VTLVMLLGMVWMSRRLPKPSLVPPVDWPRALRALRDHPVLRPLAGVAVLHGATLAMYDHLFGLHLASLGFDSTLLGTAVGLGVAGEVLVMALGGPLLRRFGGLALMSVAVLSGLPRWWATATLTAPHWLVATQALHGLTFGAWWIGGVQLFAESAPKGLENTSQSILLACSFGVGAILAMVATASLLDSHGTKTLFQLAAVLSGLAALGLIRVALRPRQS
jgi:MFS family permease